MITLCSNAVYHGNETCLPKEILERTSSISSSYPAVEARAKLNLQLNIENLNDSFIMKYDDV